MTNTEDVPLKPGQFDYVVHRGKIYDVRQDGFGEDHYFVEVDEIPEEYMERWNDE